MCIRDRTSSIALWATSGKSTTTPPCTRWLSLIHILHENEPEWNIRTEHEGMFTERGIKIKALSARKKPGDDSVTWIEPKVLKRMAREAAEAEGGL